MCGLAGCFGATDIEAVNRMLDAQAHRGPDGSGVWVDEVGGHVLGHRRLAIVDTTAAGNQPMGEVTGRIHVALNGEIYNYRELRQTLEERGYTFYTRTDTEVAAAAYHAWGTDAFTRFVGMFAMAIIDRAPPKDAPACVLVRDRLGIKPLLYGANQGALWFASELRALRAGGVLPWTLNAAALGDYLVVGAAQQPNTFVRDVRALEPGHFLALKDGVATVTRYWDLHDSTQSLRDTLRTLSAEEAGVELRRLLEEAARYHMIADVPVGTFLSGGVDSAAVAALAAGTGSKRLPTYAVGFEAGRRGAFDERALARQSAAFLGTDHRELVVADAQAGELFAHVVQSVDQPSVDGTNTWLASSLACRDVTVVLSGLGSDEVFAGYPHFWWDAPAAPSRRRALERLWQTYPHWRLARALQQRTAGFERLRFVRRLLTDDLAHWAVRSRWRDGGWQRAKERYQWRSLDDVDGSQELSYGEVTMYLQSTLLRDADVMSMAHSIELRPLFLHHPVVEFGYALPHALKVREHRGKRVLLDAVSDLLPPHLAARPKRGFELPFRRWMCHPSLRPRLHHLLTGTHATRLFNGHYLRGLRARLAVGRPPRSLWAWGVLLAWLEANHVEL